jgi:hypothetical protein|tara:strand:- start:53 stop:478 length:426 start_codon:yes stop_codon:yes gene_type:complete
MFNVQNAHLSKRTPCRIFKKNRLHDAGLKYPDQQLRKPEQDQKQKQNGKYLSDQTLFFFIVFHAVGFTAINSGAKRTKPAAGLGQNICLGAVVILATGIALLPIAGFLLSVPMGRGKNTLDRAGFAVLINNVFDPGQARDY